MGRYAEPVAQEPTGHELPPDVKSVVVKKVSSYRDVCQLGATSRAWYHASCPSHSAFAGYIKLGKWVPDDRTASIPYSDIALSALKYSARALSRGHEKGDLEQVAKYSRRLQVLSRNHVEAPAFLERAFPRLRGINLEDWQKLSKLQSQNPQWSPLLLGRLAFRPDAERTFFSEEHWKGAQNLERTAHYRTPGAAQLFPSEISRLLRQEGSEQAVLGAMHFAFGVTPFVALMDAVIGEIGRAGEEAQVSMASRLIRCVNSCNGFEWLTLEQRKNLLAVLMKRAFDVDQSDFTPIKNDEVVKLLQAEAVPVVAEMLKYSRPCANTLQRFKSHMSAVCEIDRLALRLLTTDQFLSHTARVKVAFAYYESLIDRKLWKHFLMLYMYEIKSRAIKDPSIKSICEALTLNCAALTKKAMKKWG